MQQVYLLLRSNKQAGPFTLAELLQAELKPTDLIWVEGKSAAWSYPSEIKELQPYLQPDGPTPEQQPVASALPTSNDAASAPKEQQTKPKKIFVSLPQRLKEKTAAVTPPPVEDTIEQKAEALRQKLQSYQPTTEKSWHTGYTRTTDALAAETRQKEVRQQTKVQPLYNNQYVQLAAIVLVFIGVFFIFKPSDTTEIGTAIPQTQFPQTQTEAEPAATAPMEASEVAATDAEPQVRSVAQGTQTTRPKEEPPAIMNKQTAGQPQFESTETASSGPVVENVEPEATTEEVAQQKEKRKTVGEAIDDFFGQFKSKKNKEGGTAAKDASGERKASKRDEAAAAPPDPAELAAQVKVTASEPAENWMMGLKGIKLTLHNQSAYKLKTAVVEVAYFDDQNTLLEKKTVTFNNVPAHKTVTMPAPDHRLASYARHQLLSAGADESSYANR